MQVENVIDIDQEYLQAVAHKDMKTAQKLVDRAAKRSGYTVRAFSGAKSGIKIFKIPLDKYKVGFFASSNPKTAESFAKWNRGVVYSLWLKMENPFVINARKASYSSIPIPRIMKKDFYPGMKFMDTDNVAEWAYKKGYDSAVIKDVFEGNLNTEYGNDYIVFHPSQIKSAEPVLFDEEGEVIPLSHRFRAGSCDITEALANKVLECVHLLK